MILTATLLAAALLPLARPAAAQRTVRGYALGVVSAYGPSIYGSGAATDFQRLRLMAAPRLRSLRFDVAYEHTLLWRDHDATAVALGGVRVPAARRDLDWSLVDASRVVWRHRFDRLSIGLSGGRFQATVGRQAISWATTLLLTPADPFAPFDPTDPFREYRAGTDALRLQFFPGPFSSVDAVASTRTTPDGRLTDVLLRAQHALGDWSLSGWTGLLDRHAAAALAAAGALGPWGARAETELRHDPGGGAAVRLALGVDRRVTFVGRDLYLLFEAQHDDFGAAAPRDLAAVALSAPARRGELQLLSRDALAAQASYALHPLLTADLLALVSVDDGSGLLAPALSLSAGEEATLRAGAFLGVGPDLAGGTGGLGGAAALPASAFGPTPLYGYVALTLFF